MDVLLSIKPKYIEEIAKRNKRYEFRKTPFKRDVNKVWVYSTSPIKKIVGRFEIGDIIEDTPKNLWGNLNRLSGLSEQEFFDYFDGKKVGFALCLEHIELFKNPIDPKEFFPDFTPPQSFYYFDNNLIEDAGISQ